MSNEVAALQADAEALRLVLSNQEFPDDEIVNALRNEIDQLALTSIRLAREPIRIGIVGELSAGKSALIGTLLGRPDLLPTGHQASGIVTALHLEPGDPGEPTRLAGDAEVSYLSRAELSMCLRYVLDELSRVVLAATPSADVSWLDGYDPLTIGWRRLEEWLRNQRPGAESANPEQPMIATELERIRDAQLSAGWLLGERLGVSDLLLRQALAEGEPSPPANPITKDSLLRDSADLRATFPLVKRVAYRVQVKPSVWPLADLLGGNQVVILDFPSLDASPTTRRGEYLSRAELRDTHTVVTVISANRSRTAVLARFHSMLERPGSDHIGQDPVALRDSILVAGSRFDIINPPRPEPEGPVGINDLCALSPDLKNFCATASDLTQGKVSRIQLTSSAIGAGSALDRAAAWRAIGRRLAATDPADSWAKVITALADDGGMASLRQLIDEHASSHGLAYKIRALRRLHAQMQEQLPRLAELLRADQLSVDPSQRMREVLDAVRSHCRGTREELDLLSDPQSLALPNGTRLLEGVRAAAITEVMQWRDWDQILERGDQGGFIPKVRRGSDPGDRKADYDTTASFLPEYRATLRSAITSGRNELRDLVNNWIDEQNERAADLVDRLTDPTTKALLDAALPSISANHGGADIGRSLALITDLSWLKTWLNDAISAEFGDDDADETYPLYVDRALPWHPQIAEPEDDVLQHLGRHQFYAFRLQWQLANGVADALVKRLEADTINVYEQIRSVLERLARVLPSPADLRTMFPPDAADGAADVRRPASTLLDYLAERADVHVA